MSRVCAVITRKLVGVSRSDAGVAPTGVGGGLEARITCGKKISVQQRLKDRRRAGLSAVGHLVDVLRISFLHEPDKPESQSGIRADSGVCACAAPCQ